MEAFLKNSFAKSLALSEWHGDACHICGQQMVFTRKVTPLRASLDHLVPKSEGGDNDGTNLLLAHQICNSLRSSEPLSDHLRSRCEVAVQAVHLFGKKSPLVMVAVRAQAGAQVAL